jgi:hypothetical protein
MKHHLKHLGMCAPMIVVAAVLLASGSGLGILIPLAACMLIMAMMMWAMTNTTPADAGPVIKTSLSDEEEQRLRAALGEQ